MALLHTFDQKLRAITLTRIKYSCSHLEEDDPYRRLKASEVRRQGMDAPEKRYRMQPKEGSTSKRKPPLSDYPKTFKNTENLDLSMKRTWKE